MRCDLTLFRLLSHTLSKDSIFWHTPLSGQQGVLFIWSPRVSKNLFVKMKTTDSFWTKYTPRGEPVNYVEPPTINVDMFTDLVHQHTHAHRHNWSTISVLTGAAIICGLICSDLTSVCANAALFLCMYPSEHETPSEPTDPDMSYSTGPFGARKHFFLLRFQWSTYPQISGVSCVPKQSLTL